MNDRENELLVTPIDLRSLVAATGLEGLVQFSDSLPIERVHQIFGGLHLVVGFVTSQGRLVGEISWTDLNKINEHRWNELEGLARHRSLLQAEER